MGLNYGPPLAPTLTSRHVRFSAACDRTSVSRSVLIHEYAPWS